MIPPTSTPTTRPSRQTLIIPVGSSPRLRSRSRSRPPHTPSPAASPTPQHASPLSPSTPSKAKSPRRSTLSRLYDQNRGVLLVLLAQLFGTAMNVATRLLETPAPPLPPLHPFSILFARMSITLVLSVAYMASRNHPEFRTFPPGRADVRWLLLARGVGGFWGVFGMYWSLRYLAVSEATVISFLAPGLTVAVMAALRGERFGWAERGVIAVSLAGVGVIARPGLRGPDAAADAPTAPQRLLAVGMGLAGVLGAITAYTTIRLIGLRAHPLISVTYFSAVSTAVAAAALVLPTGVPFVLPRGGYQWGLLLFLGVNGFVLQFLLTSGLRGEKSSRSTMMVYSSAVFAVVADWGVWGVVPDVWSWIGGGMILGSAIFVALMRDEGGGKKEEEKGDEEEGVALVGGQIEGEAAGGDVELGEMDGAQDGVEK